MLRNLRSRSSFLLMTARARGWLGGGVRLVAALALAVGRRRPGRHERAFARVATRARRRLRSHRGMSGAMAALTLAVRSRDARHLGVAVGTTTGSAERRAVWLMAVRAVPGM